MVAVGVVGVVHDRMLPLKRIVAGKEGPGLVDGEKGEDTHCGEAAWSWCAHACVCVCVCVYGLLL